MTDVIVADPPRFLVATPEEFLAASVPERRKLVLAQIEAEPEHHDQAYWIVDKGTCGTAACMAGWACVLAGDVPTRGYVEDCSRYSAAASWWAYDHVESNGVVVDAETRANELLDMDSEAFGLGNEEAIQWLRENSK
jgi:hypothetical protein